MNGGFDIVPDAEALARALADLIVKIGRMSTDDGGAFRIALSGGNTPRAAYELLATQPWRDQLSWSDVFVYFGDERCVPPDDERSNYRMACEALLDKVPIPPKNVHRMRGEIDPTAAAAEYAQMLRDGLGSPPQFDLVLLGLGPDGHTASLFPGSPPTENDAAFVRAVYVQSQAMWRITITPSVINRAGTVAFAVEGSEKAAILATVSQGPFQPATYPAQIVAPSPGNLVWLVDEAAAGTLHAQP